MATRVAVVGGGTAGFMAAAHLSRHFPELRLVQVLDPRIPTIGVGEGTTPGFRSWLEELSGADFPALQRELRATRKRGVQFEKWGRIHRSFCHDFVPADAVGLHLSASQLVVFLRRHVRGELLEANVAGIEGGEDGAVVKLEDGRDIEVDVAIDARGFPPRLDHRHLALSWIPTNSALVTRTPVIRPELDRTRAIARSHGWVFVIPLTADTAYGYVYGCETAAQDEVMADFAELLASEGIGEYLEPRSIQFPNYLCKVPFQGRVLKLGNAASFIEPLEATAIAIVRYELNFLSAWLRALEAARGGRIAAHLVGDLNRRYVELVLEVSLFVGWHYAEGSVFDTEFWRRARARFHRDLDSAVPAAVRERFLDQVDHASRIRPGALAALRTAADLERVIPEHRRFPPPFGGMTPLGFAQVARGIGYSLVATSG